MGVCLNRGCGNETKDDKPYCFDCYTKWKDRNQGATTKKNEWNNDPMIDILTKINANLGMIASHLEELKGKKKEKKKAEE